MIYPFGGPGVWGDTWAAGPGRTPVVLVHNACGNVTQPVLTCPHCHGEVSPGIRAASRAPGAASLNRAAAGVIMTRCSQNCSKMITEQTSEPQRGPG